MKKFLKISIFVCAALSMFCGCKADGSLDEEKISGIVNSNGNNEDKNENDASGEKTGINCLSVYNSASGNGVQLMLSNLPDGCNNVDVFYMPEDYSYWQRISTINASERKQFSFPYVNAGKSYNFYVRFSHAEFGLEAIQLGYSNIVEIKPDGGKGEVSIKQKSIKSKYENGIISFGKIEVENYEYISAELFLSLLPKIGSIWGAWKKTLILKMSFHLILLIILAVSTTLKGINTILMFILNLVMMSDCIFPMAFVSQILVMDMNH